MSSSENSREKSRSESLLPDKTSWHAAAPDCEPQKLLSGNEAVAQGAWEAGVHVACGYPGTPSTEILETLSRFSEVKCEWSTNEKVALEIALGASFAGARVLVTMKHVGLNVAADPFFSSAYTGVNGGLVIISADDPGMHSSQNEQDNRLLAVAARIPVMEPASSQEAREFVIAAFQMSEKIDMPVLIRTTTRIAHGKAPVAIGTRKAVPRLPYKKVPSKYILLPSNSRNRHKRLETLLMPLLRKESAHWIEVHQGTNDLAFITSGACFFYVREAFPDASVLKIGMTYPLPEPEILEFCANKERIIVVEELEPFMEQRIAALGIEVEGKNLLPRYGEFSVDVLRNAILPHAIMTQVPVAAAIKSSLPPRPPVMCAGCSHRGTFYALRQLNAIVAGDVGCYTLGALEPLNAIDCSINMGASISMAHGMEKVMDEPERKRLVSVIGDSTFFHSGISALVDVLYNDAHTTTVILDNHTSAMTGHQAHPGSGESITGEPARKIDIATLCKGLGVEAVRRSDPYDLLGTLRIIDEELHREAPSVIVADAPCALKSRIRFGAPVTLQASQCTECFSCTQIGCPAIEIENGHLQINSLLCVACGQCGQVCSDCNAGVDVPLVLELVSQNRYREAFNVVIKQSPFPAVASRVCPRPCERRVNSLGYSQETVRAQLYPELVREFPGKKNQESISIHAIERFLGDYGIVNVDGSEFLPVDELGISVAIVGAGPAGLSAAWHLRRIGYSVVVFDANASPGGMLRYGIPDFRLPRDILNAEIQRLEAIGVQFRCNTAVGKDIPLNDITAAYSAVVLAVGESKPRDVQLRNADNVTSGLYDGLSFLHQYNSGNQVPLSGRVAVVGGGNTAIDCARCATRLGASVTVYYRRGEQDMSAHSDEIEEAVLEGVQFEFWATPVRVQPTEGKLSGLVFARTRPGTLRQLFEVSKDEFFVDLELAILAVGEQTEMNLPEELGVGDSRGIRSNFMGVTSVPGVFGCGDAAFGHGTVTQAISTGKRVAESVDAYMRENNLHTVRLK